MSGIKEMVDKVDEKEMIVLRWIEPDVWGFRAWSMLYGLKIDIESGGKKWIELINLLPFLLPCFTCRVCAGKFIKNTPPEWKNSIEWLDKLRKNVWDRNLSSPDVNKLDLLVTIPTDHSRFQKRQLLPFLWKFDTYFFIITIALTINLTKHLKEFIRFIQLLTELTPIHLTLNLNTNNITSFKSDIDIIQWLLSLPTIPTIPLQTITNSITIKQKSEILY